MIMKQFYQNSLEIYGCNFSLSLFITIFFKVVIRRLICVDSQLTQVVLFWSESRPESFEFALYYFTSN